MAIKWENLEEMDTVLEKYDLLELKPGRKRKYKQINHKQSQQDYNQKSSNKEKSRAT